MTCCCISTPCRVRPPPVSKLMYHTRNTQLLSLNSWRNRHKEQSLFNKHPCIILKSLMYHTKITQLLTQQTKEQSPFNQQIIFKTPATEVSKIGIWNSVCYVILKSLNYPLKCKVSTPPLLLKILKWRQKKGKWLQTQVAETRMPSLFITNECVWELLSRAAFIHIR